MNWPFDIDVPKHKWTSIAASGFSNPVVGCVYEGHRLDGGLPLGALGTGYFTLEGDGSVGHCSIYNEIMPPRNVAAQWLTLQVGNVSLPLSTASITYWGHYPVADIVARFDEQPLDVGIRAFCPFIPGNAADSNIPVALFDIEVRNRGSELLDCQLTVMPPVAKDDSADGFLQKSPVDRVDEYACLDSLEKRLDVSSNGGELRGVTSFQLPAGESSRIRFGFGWYAPRWRDSGNERHVHRYAQRYASARAVVDDALARYDDLLSRVLAWQQAVYDSGYDGWLCDWLIQGLYSMAKNTVWIARTRSDEWWGQDGWFSHNESHTGCPITETLVCRMHGHMPIMFFFPELELTTLDAFRHFQIEDGEVPFTYGRGTSMRDPRYHCQHPLNSGQYAQMVYRQFLRTGDREQLADFYPSAKRAIRYQFTLDDDDDGLVNDQAHVMPGEKYSSNQFYDLWPWYGTSAYVAGTWLATLSIGRELARIAGDDEFAAELEGWLARGGKSYQEKLWTGQYYRVWTDTASNRRADVSLANQLMAEWCVHVAALPGVLPKKQVQTTLNSIEQFNMGATAYGLINGVTPDGARYDDALSPRSDHEQHTFVGESLCAAMTYMYHGRKETGIEIVRRLYEAIAIKSASPWNQRCLIHGRSGLPVWGDDYYSNMAIWAVPMAMAGQGIGEFVKTSSLLRQMMAT